ALHERVEVDVHALLEELAQLLLGEGRWRLLAGFAALGILAELHEELDELRLEVAAVVDVVWALVVLLGLALADVAHLCLAALAAELSAGVHRRVGHALHR